jgi:hypothetical protein
MCLPLAVAAAGAAAAGQLAGGVGALQQGNYESQIAKRNAAMEIEAAHDSVTQGRNEARSFYRTVGRTKGDEIAAMAANNIDVGFGSAERVQEDAQQGADEDAQTLYKNIYERTRGHYIDATNYVQQAKAAKMKGRAEMVGSVIKAGSSLMSGFQQQGMMKAKLGLGG